MDQRTAEGSDVVIDELDEEVMTQVETDELVRL